MIRSRTGSLLALLASACLLGLPATAAAEHVHCGDVIAQDTTLDGDLACAGDALELAADGVTLDLGGHTIRQSGAAGRGVVAWAGNRVVIRNGTIQGFADGVETDGARGTTLHDMVLEGNGNGLRCAYAPECRIEDSTVRDNGVGIQVASADGGSREPTIVRRNRIHDNGVGVTITGESAVVSENRIERNRTDGIRNDYGYPVEIERNVVAHNGGDGVHVWYIADATVAKNRIFDNGANGVAVFGSFGQFGDTAADIRDNRITGNDQDGVLVRDPGIVATVERNHTDRNGDDGIEVDHGPTSDLCCFDVVVSANRAFFNADLGIEAVPAATDGGGNRAKHNGDPAQCVGVSCR